MKKSLNNFMKTADVFVQNKIGKGECKHTTMQKFHKNYSVITEA